MKYLTRTIWILACISLLTDIASEMLYPVMPVYLRSIGFSVLLIGVLEGLAEATAGLSKGYFGKLSDARGKRVPFVRMGYALSAMSKPMMAAFVYPVWIFLARTIDRLGKGIRTGARDAMLSDEATESTKGRVFGFHRSMDTMGAVAGPAFALAWLLFNPGRYRLLFLVALVPGMLAIALSLLLRDKDSTGAETRMTVSFLSFFHYWKIGPPVYRRLVVGLLIFSLCNSSDVFLLLRVKQAGLSDTVTIAVYIFYNLVYALSAFPFGGLADRIGFKKVLLVGVALFATVYAGMAWQGGFVWYLTLLFVYGLYAAATEGVAKAWISNIAERADTGTAIGAFTGMQSICAFFASALTGWIWGQFGAVAAFLSSAAIAVVSLLYIKWAVSSDRH